MGLRVQAQYSAQFKKFTFHVITNQPISGLLKVLLVRDTHWAEIGLQMQTGPINFYYLHLLVLCLYKEWVQPIYDLSCTIPFTNKAGRTGTVPNLCPLLHHPLYLQSR